MEFDHIAERKQEQKATTWLRLWSNRQPELLSMHLAHKHRPASGKPISACLWKSGAFNICYQVRYNNSNEEPDIIIRFAALGRAILRREKVQNEVATMNYLRKTTSIPIPEVYASGICWAGPYIIMSIIEGVPLSQLLKDHSVEGRPVLNPQISNHSLKHAYREMAILVLELSRVELDSIGALQDTKHDCFTITKRPLTFNMNELMASANLPLEAFPPPSHTFTSSTDYFYSLATQHLLHLRLQQQNPSITSEEDFQRKLIARYLFQNLTKNLHLTNPQGPSFTYVAPWWLLLQSPEDWEGDLHQFLDRYIPRCNVFLEVLRECEDELIGQGLLSESQRLASRMGESLDNGLFWMCLAARYSSMFDEIYWGFVDRRFYGDLGSLQDRVRLLSEEQRREMDELVRGKMGQCDRGEDEFEDHYPIDMLLEL
ncbi:phosphotransferase family protein [Aspergillus vadensis CBS 113365]|uniref:Phosphotransferase family protein n=1 Tax=Aspergillus vadensis (strain CBS 113365 / IMI 142717 / IBT 24658) TaxID=1448311 RepID=A0A319AV37_ASPVC|nr:phosphotransferase family protein [Aspergillus vadensis CBS 113365]PYH64227.1 phosphotransferase family protein [Aspergillus vadensis CBS 113365]